VSDLVASFTVEGEPASKSRARFTKRGSKTVAYTPEKTKQAEERVAWIYRSSGGRPHKNDTTQAFGVEATFYYSHNQRRDVDNMLKLILDGLNGIAWPDDVQVTQVTARKAWVPKGEARTEVRIYDLGSITRPTKACLHCGKDFPVFTSTADRQKFCSRACGYAHRVAQRTSECLNCGAEFLAHGAVRGQQFCGLPCANTYRSVEVACVACGVTFRKPRSLANRGKPLCSDECRVAYYREQRTERARGTCAACGGPTSKKTYTHCRACRFELLASQSKESA